VKVTLKDIAQQSGYSITTVSRALAGYSDVNAQTRQHIIEIANTLGYQPNLLARQLRSQRTQTIGLIIPARDNGFSNEFFAQLMLGIGDAASQENYDLLVSAQKPGEEEMEAYRRIAGGNRVDGMILARTRYNDPRISYLKSRDHPFVVFGRGAPGEDSDFPYIDVDGQAAIQVVTQHIIERGHRHIGLILPPPDIAFTQYRLAGYQQALAQAGIPYRPEYVVNGDLLRAGGYQGARRLLEHQAELTAIVACNDLMALGAMKAVQERGYQVGRTFAIAGYDDIPAAEYAQPPLTTIHQPLHEIGQRLVQMLIKIIAGNPPEDTHLLLPSKLIVRESSGF